MRVLCALRIYWILNYVLCLFKTILQNGNTKQHLMAWWLWTVNYKAYGGKQWRLIVRIKLENFNSNYSTSRFKILYYHRVALTTIICLYERAGVAQCGCGLMTELRFMSGAGTCRQVQAGCGASWRSKGTQRVADCLELRSKMRTDSPQYFYTPSNFGTKPSTKNYNP
jgi:hypothetical protein